MNEIKALGTKNLGIDRHDQIESWNKLTKKHIRWNNKLVRSQNMIKILNSYACMTEVLYIICELLFSIFTATRDGLYRRTRKKYLQEVTF
ncbi:hypothetical protein VNO78_18546 [Psophocarpus tetragonolobus]|uniref:Uncharacterized protein n=1 Tax=Psophocarpus tetragonolobus TaxID=3891 RepID=A0AAN9XMA5_PSOTE